MDTLFSMYNSGFFSTYNFESKIYKPLLDNRKYSTLKIKNIPCHFNIISDSKTKRGAVMIFINVGYFHESQNIKYDNYIKLILEIIFERKNDFNELFLKYNLNYYNKIEIEKTIIYLEFDYIGLEIILSSFIKTIINIDNLLVQNNPKDILKIISIANNTDSDYIYYKKFIENVLLKNINNNNDNNKGNNYQKELNVEEFFQYYFLKNDNIQITIFSPYSINKCEILLNKIFNNLRYKIKNKIISRYERYKGNKDLNPKIFTYIEPSLLIINNIDITENNILKLIFSFSSLKSKDQNILEYFVYMLTGKKRGSFYYDLFFRKLFDDVEVYSKYNINTPSQLIIEFKLYNYFPFENLFIIISKLINFLRKLKTDRVLIEKTYNNYQKILYNRFIFKENHSKNGYYNDLYYITNNFILLKDNNYINLLSYKYLLPVYNIDLVEDIIDEIISLNNLYIIIELFPKTFQPFLLNLTYIKTSNFIINKSFELNEYHTNLTVKINKIKIIDFANTSKMNDERMFKHKQDKSIYLSNQKFIIENNSNVINNNIQLVLNNIANKLWYKIDYNIKTPKIFSSFHIIHPNIRNNSSNISKTNIKYFHLLEKAIEIEFEELYDINNINFYNDYYINLSKDENGINLEINTYKDVYLIIIKKIFSFIFDYEKYSLEHNTNYNTNSFKDKICRSLWYLKQVIKKDINEKYFNAIDNIINVVNIKNYGNEINQNMYIDGLLYGFLDFDIIKEVRNILYTYNTREYDNFCFYENIPDFKKRIYEYKKIKEGNIYVYKLRQNFIEDNVSYYLSFYQLIDCDKQKELFIIIIYLLLKLYIPECEVYKIFTDNIYYLLIIRKNFDSPEDSALQVSINIKKFVDIIYNKSNVEMKKICFSIKDEINNEINNINNKYNYIWNEIYYDRYNFEGYDQLKENYNKYFSIKNNKTNLEWIKELKIFIKDNLFDKQRKVEFLLYRDFLTVNNTKDKKLYPWNFYNDYSLNVFSYNYIGYINEEK